MKLDLKKHEKSKIANILFYEKFREYMNVIKMQITFTYTLNLFSVIPTKFAQ